MELEMAPHLPFRKESIWSWCQFSLKCQDCQWSRLDQRTTFYRWQAPEGKGLACLAFVVSLVLIFFKTALLQYEA